MAGLFEKYQWLSKCAGIELYILPDNSFLLKTCSVDLENNKLTISEKSEVAGTLQSVVKKTTRKEPVAINITGRGVLTKKIPVIESITQETLNRAFPNLSITDFYIQNFTSGNFSFVSIIRKEIADEILGAFNDSGNTVLVISLGPFVFFQVSNQVNTYGLKIQFDGHQIFFAENRDWEDYKFIPGASSEFPLKIENEKIEEKYLLAYAAGFQLALYNRLDPVAAESIDTGLVDFLEKKKFTFRLGAVLAMFFALLLVNFLVFSYYHDKNEYLLSQVTRYSFDSESLSKISEELKENENLLKELGWNQGLRFSFICDEVGKTTPKGINLNNLTINPLNSNLSQERQTAVYENGQVKISGKTIDMGSVNNWIYLLREKQWIKQVVLDSYSPSDEDETNKSPRFTLRIFF